MNRVLIAVDARAEDVRKAQQHRKRDALLFEVAREVEQIQLRARDDRHPDARRRAPASLMSKNPAPHPSMLYSGARIVDRPRRAHGFGARSRARLRSAAARRVAGHHRLPRLVHRPDPPPARSPVSVSLTGPLAVVMSRHPTARRMKLRKPSVQNTVRITSCAPSPPRAHVRQRRRQRAAHPLRHIDERVDQHCIL